MEVLASGRGDPGNSVTRLQNKSGGLSPSAFAVAARGLLLLRHRAEEDIFERSGLLVAQLGVGHGFARNHLVAHGGVVEEDGLDGGDLREIGRLQALVGVHVGVVSAAFVVGRILNELEAGQADGVE